MWFPCADAHNALAFSLNVLFSVEDQTRLHSSQYQSLQDALLEHLESCPELPFGIGDVGVWIIAPQDAVGSQTRQSLTSERLVPFIGGQLQILNEKEGYLYRVEIAGISLKDGTLFVLFAWLAKGEGYPPLPTRWINASKLDYTFSLEFALVSDIGMRLIAFTSHITGELVVLYPPGGSKLEPSKVVCLMPQ